MGAPLKSAKVSLVLQQQQAASQDRWRHLSRRSLTHPRCAWPLIPALCSGVKGGSLPAVLPGLSSLTSLDLSDNNFEGMGPLDSLHALVRLPKLQVTCRQGCLAVVCRSVLRCAMSVLCCVMGKGAAGQSHGRCCLLR